MIAQSELYFSSVSHDMRTPLNAIIGYAELLKLGIDDPAEREKALDAIVTSGRTLLELVNDILDISKLDAGQMAIMPKPTDCVRLAEDVVSTFGYEASRKGISVIASHAGAMPALMVDPQRLKQILLNLVGNAVKFTSTGSVRAHLGYADGTLTIRVVDSGPGIRKEDIERIMLPFAQAESGVSGGTGLGLAVCKGLVERMDGSIVVKSVKGKGSAFVATLRGIAAAPEPVIPDAASMSGGRAFAKLPAKSILVVDDSPINRAVLTALLKRLGQTEVDEAESGAEAISRLRAKKYDVLLTDLWMPGMSGTALAKRIRSVPELASVPVYAVTADVEARKPEVESLFSGVLLKPVTLARVDRLLRQL